MPRLRDFNQVLVTGGAGFLGSHLCDRLIAEGVTVLCLDNFFTGSRRNVAQLLGHPRFELIRHDVTFPVYPRGRRDLQPRLRRLPDPLPVRSRADHQVERPRRDQHAGPRQAHARADPAGLHQRGLRRSGGAPAARGLLGPRQPDRAARLLRRGQALRRDAVLRLPPPAPAADQGRADLQHLRPAHAPQRRPRGVELHPPGVAQRADHALRRRPPDALVLLRRPT